MKKFILLIQFCFVTLIGFSQTNTITLSFSGKDAQSQNVVVLQSVLIRNVTLGCDTMLLGASPSVVITNSLGIPENSLSGSESFAVMQNTPNPFFGSTTVNVNLIKKEKLTLSVLTAQGKTLSTFKNDFPVGMHKFEITSSSPDLLILQVTDGYTTKSIKLMNIARHKGNDEIRHIGAGEQTIANQYKSAKSSRFIFHLGDSLLFTATANGYQDGAIGARPMQSASYTFLLTPVLLDGFYVVGAATAYSALNSNARMKIARNEVTQLDRASLLELYIPVRAIKEGFNIISVAGSVQTIYHPGADFGIATNVTWNEPTVPFQRGSATKTGSGVFAVPADGMYHVVIDYALSKASIVPVHWGLIGAATPVGWSYSTQMTESAFDLHTMSWTISDLPLRAYDWKFRYSNGWKVVLDTLLDVGGGMKGVNFNTNLGGLNAGQSLPDPLVPGGMNFTNGNAGIYTCTISYSLGSLYMATMTKTGELPLTNWTGVVCDAVGTGISIDNATAHADTSAWQWGNQMPADNGGIPVVTNSTYTWTWTRVILEANEGFKIRTLNGLAPPIGGENFDAGYSELNIAASSSNIINNSGNLMAIVRKAYTITLVIDAANSNHKEITIVEF
ncbi:MAG: hypothetical protein NTW16_05940 [Bacteroidetes bacterium]|nr:hypothetical protein [Bacteroidota bacterium]